MCKGSKQFAHHEEEIINSVVVEKERLGQRVATGMMETAQVASTSGVTLAVRAFRPATNRAKKLITLVLVHQYSLMGGCQELLRGMAYRLAHQGYPTVTFDMRGVGGSTGKPSITGSSEVQDVIAVAKWASAHYTPSILLVGSSAGTPPPSRSIHQFPNLHHSTLAVATCSNCSIFLAPCD